MIESIGAALRTARERRHLTLAQVSEATRVRTHYLQALENDDLSAMPSAAQARGFLRIYSQFLDLDLNALIPPPAPAPASLLAAEIPTAPTPKLEPKPKPVRPNLLTRLREAIAPDRAGEGEAASTPSVEASAGITEAPPAAVPADEPVAEVKPARKKKARS